MGGDAGMFHCVGQACGEGVVGWGGCTSGPGTGGWVHHCLGGAVGGGGACGRVVWPHPPRPGGCGVCGRRGQQWVDRFFGLRVVGVCAGVKATGEDEGWWGGCGGLLKGGGGGEVWRQGCGERGVWEVWPQ